MSANILLVDDDRHVLRYLKKALEQAGYHVAATTSGKQAMALMEKERPDLLVLDLNMPEPDGFDLLRVEHARFPYLRIIVISGYLDGALLEAAKIFGAVATLLKPVSPGDLVAKVREVLER